MPQFGGGAWQYRIAKMQEEERKERQAEMIPQQLLLGLGKTLFTLGGTAGVDAIRHFGLGGKEKLESEVGLREAQTGLAQAQTQDVPERTALEGRKVGIMEGQEGRLAQESKELSTNRLFLTNLMSDYLPKGTTWDTATQEQKASAAKSFQKKHKYAGLTVSAQGNVTIGKQPRPAGRRGPSKKELKGLRNQLVFLEENIDRMTPFGKIHVRGYGELSRSEAQVLARSIETRLAQAGAGSTPLSRQAEGRSKETRTQQGAITQGKVNTALKDARASQIDWKGGASESERNAYFRFGMSGGNPVGQMDESGREVFTLGDKSYTRQELVNKFSRIPISTLVSGTGKRRPTNKQLNDGARAVNTMQIQSRTGLGGGGDVTRLKPPRGILGEIYSPAHVEK